MDRDEVQTSTHVVVDLKVVQVILTVCVGLAPDGLVVAQKPERAASAAGSPQKLKKRNLGSNGWLRHSPVPFRVAWYGCAYLHGMAGTISHDQNKIK